MNEQRNLAVWLTLPRSTRDMLTRFGLHWRERLVELSDFEICFARGWDGERWGVHYWRTVERRSKRQRGALELLGIDPDHARVFAARPAGKPESLPNMPCMIAPVEPEPKPEPKTERPKFLAEARRE